MAAEEQAAQGNGRANGSGEHADADARLVAVNLTENDAADLDSADPNNADLGDDEFADLDADDADIQAALAGGDLEEPDLSDVAAAADDWPARNCPPKTATSPTRLRRRSRTR